MSAGTLKPCPFCGNGNLECSYGWIDCKCGMRGGYHYTDEEAIDAWNTRTNVANLFQAIGEAGALRMVQIASSNRESDGFQRPSRKCKARKSRKQRATARRRRPFANNL